jgi:ABC-2 type transport system permease protein
VLASYRSELYKLRRRPAVWVVLILWLLLMLLFTYVLPYISYRSAAGGEAQRLLATLLPSALPGQALTGYAVWGGSLVVVLGALSVGSEYGWGTITTILANRAGRMTVLAAHIAALFTALAGLVIVAFAGSGLASVLIAASAGVPRGGPAPGSLALSLAAGWLILCMWCLFGTALAILTRGAALSIGLGLVWVLAVENLIRATAPLLPALSTVEKALPGVNAGSLVAALGAPVETSGDGVVALVGGGQAAPVVFLYFVLFAVTGALVLRRRDVR